MHRSNPAAWFVLLLAAMPPVPAMAQAWRIDRGASSITFTASCAHAACAGRVRDFAADVVYDPTDPAGAKLDVRVDVRSLVMDGSPDGGTVPDAGVLDAARFPHAWLVTTRFHRAADGRIRADAELKLHGRIRPVVLAVTFTPTGHGEVVIDVATHLQLPDFGIAASGSTGEVQDGGVTVRGHFVIREPR